MDVLFFGFDPCGVAVGPSSRAVPGWDPGVLGGFSGEFGGKRAERLESCPNIEALSPGFGGQKIVRFWGQILTPILGPNFD